MPRISKERLAKALEQEKIISPAAQFHFQNAG